jgi:hypothetical protein
MYKKLPEKAAFLFNTHGLIYVNNLLLFGCRNENFAYTYCESDFLMREFDEETFTLCVICRDHTSDAGM